MNYLQHALYDKPATDVMDDLPAGWVELSRDCRTRALTKRYSADHVQPPLMSIDQPVLTMEDTDRAIRRSLLYLHRRRTYDMIDRWGLDAYQHVYGEKAKLFQWKATPVVHVSPVIHISPQPHHDTICDATVHKSTPWFTS